MPTRPRAPVALLVLLALFVCCAAPPSLPPGEGEGLMSFDEPPAGDVERFEAPTWRVGDRFVLVRGGKRRMALEVVEAKGAAYVLRDERGAELVRDRDLANLGERRPGQSDWSRMLAPKDQRYHWPLFVGKRWRCRYLDKAPGAAAQPVEAVYEVEAEDAIRTPAGSFRALRIVRTASLLREGDWADRTAIIWYAPEVGFEVRQLVGESMVELVEFRRG